MQSPRYARLLNVLREETPLNGWSEPRVADLGAGLQTELFVAARPDAKVTSVGYRDHAQAEYAGHIEYDLNAAYDKNSWPKVAEEDKFDLVIFCEVIEHLYTTPIAVLGWIRSIIKPGGYLVIQTPNAQAVTRRLRSVLGKPLYGRITNFGEPGMNPGHFREYTPGELRQMAPTRARSDAPGAHQLHPSPGHQGQGDDEGPTTSCRPIFAKAPRSFTAPSDHRQVAP